MSEIVNQSEQDQRSRLKPVPPADTVGPFLEKYWNLKVTKIRQIDSYDDANFYVETTSTRKLDEEADTMTPYLVKYYNAFDTENADMMVGLSFMLDAINKGVTTGVEVPTIFNPSTDASCDALNFVFCDACAVVDGSKQKVAVRVFQWIAGTTLSRQKPSIKQMVQLGRSIADVTRALHNFDHPAFHRTHLWDLKQLDASMPLLHYVDSAPVQECIRAVHQRFHDTILPLSAQLPTSVIMADCNDANVIVTEGDNCEVTGLIDFSDAVHTWRVNELAIAMAYALLTSFGKDEPYKALGALFVGYISLQRLTDAELDVLSTLIQVRLAISVMVGSCAISKEPENEYLKLHCIPGRAAIEFMGATDPARHRRYFALLQDEFADVQQQLKQQQQQQQQQQEGTGMSQDQIDQIVMDVQQQLKQQQQQQQQQQQEGTGMSQDQIDQIVMDEEVYIDAIDMIYINA
jgi:Ser/Thr protein kinase RdoA (MazF antagonist)